MARLTSIRHCAVVVLVIAIVDNVACAYAAESTTRQATIKVLRNSYKPHILGTVLLSEGFENSDFNTNFRYSGDGNISGASIVSAPVRSGKKAVRIILDRAMPNKFRTELQPRGKWQAPTFGGTYWYALSVFIGADWVIDPEPELIAQWHGRPDRDLGEHWRNPALALYIHEAHYEFTRKWDSKLIGNRNYDGQDRTNLGSIRSDIGKWTDWGFQVRWAYRSGSGFTKIWKNGVLVYDARGPNCFNDRAGGPYFKFGIYKWVWKKDRSFVTSHRELYFDDIFVARQF